MAWSKTGNIRGPQGAAGPIGPQGPPGVVSSASSYVIVGPGRPDVPSTTAGTITGNEPVGAEYRSQDGAQVGAFVWMKRPGGTWEVTDGDTGWRVLYGSSNPTGTGVTGMSLNPSASSCGVLLRRTAQAVKMQIYGMEYSTTSQVSIPAGFGVRATSGAYPMENFSHQGSTNSVGVVRIGVSTLYLAFPSSGVMSPPYGPTISWDPRPTWPTAPLPGTPA